jgi:type III secretory pathway lipoprotein EscJ
VDNVVSARVHLAAEPKSALSANGAGVPTASVLIRYRGGRPPLPDADVRRLVAGAVAGLAPDRVHVVIAAAAPAKAADRPLVRFGPISTTQDALPRLRLVVAAAAVLGIVLAVALITLWTRLRSLRARLAAPSDARR